MMTRTPATYVAFDLGASSGRAMVGHFADGRLEMREAHRFQTPIRATDGHLYWDVDALWKEIETGLDAARAGGGELRSVSVDSWGVDYAPLDEAGQLVRLPYCYRDTRTSGMMARARDAVDPQVIYETTGIQFMEINTIYQVMADRLLEPSLIERTRQRLLIGDYFNYRLSGEAVAERSLASTTQLMNAITGEWDARLMGGLDLDDGAWPSIVASGTRLGPVQGMRDVTAIAGCSHDTACAVAAVPAEAGEADWAYVSCGTWSLLGVEIDAPNLTAAAREAGFTNEAGIDGTVRFLKNMTGLWILQECRRVWQESGIRVTLEELLADAEAAPVPESLIDVRHAAFGQRCDMPQAIRDYCESNELPAPEDRGRLVRLVIESLAEGHRVTLRELESVLGRRIGTLYAVGGGAMNELLCQATADRCGCRVVAGPAEATAMGNLLVQARTMGDLGGDDIREVVRRTATLKTYEPRSR